MMSLFRMGVSRLLGYTMLMLTFYSYVLRL